MNIWVDADACPKVIKEILYRAAERTKTFTILVSNSHLRVPQSEFISTILVPQGFDVADEQIVRQISPGDLVITADIPLASAVIERNAFALNPRGTFYSKGNIGERLAVRNLLDELRASGVVTTGPPPLNQNDRQAFANQLDKFLTKLK